MPKITFRGTRIRYIDIRRDEAGVFTRVHFSAQYSTPVQESMGWDEIPESISQCKLTGQLNASMMILTPHDPALAAYERQLSINEVSDFAVHRTQKDESTRTELRFIARTPADGMVAIIEDYFRAVGDAEAALTVRYSEQAELDEQEDLPLAEGEDDGANTLASVTTMKRRARGK